MSTTFDMRIASLVYGGDALGRASDGKAIFVPYAIPGEMVRVKLVEEKTHHARAKLVEVLEPSADRVTSRCQHFTMCGGCHYQHMDYPAQLKAKAAIIKEQMERIGGFTEVPVIEIEAAPKPWFYRNHIQFHLTNEGKLGFQKANSNQTLAIRECHLPEAAINQLWPQIDIEPQARVERISLRSGADGDLMVILESSDPQPVEFRIEDLSISVVQAGPSGSRILAGSDHIFMEVLGRHFIVSAASFFQVNSELACAMVRHLLAYLPLKDDMTVLDVYSGVGLFSAFIAQKVKRLVGIEISSEACEDFTTNLDEYDHVELYEAAAEEVLTGVNFNPDLIVMDPPRSGLGTKTVEGILAQGADHLVYISCDPATLARDGKQLAAGGYSLMKVSLFDMFSQTYHIESMSFWEKN
jgi:23S rRNA (uracil1939-C5)-methyltransferase